MDREREKRERRERKRERERERERELARTPCSSRRGVGWVGHCCPPGGGGVVIPLFSKGNTVEHDKFRPFLALF